MQPAVLDLEHAILADTKHGRVTIPTNTQHGDGLDAAAAPVDPNAPRSPGERHVGENTRNSHKIALKLPSIKRKHRHTGIADDDFGLSPKSGRENSSTTLLSKPKPSSNDRTTKAGPNLPENLMVILPLGKTTSTDAYRSGPEA